MTQAEILLQMTLKAWHTQVARVDKFFDARSPESFEKEIAPGKNRIIYLLGHLVATNDSMMSLFGFGDRLFPAYEDPFVKNPDKSGKQIPSAQELLKSWRESSKALAENFSKLTVDEWLSRHTAMTDEDLAKEPTRNKLSVLISRTNHVAYHVGQLVLVK